MISNQSAIDEQNKRDLSQPIMKTTNNRLVSENPENRVDALYGSPIASTRTGAIFNAHSYPTKINPEAIVPFIMAHTVPGACVFDGFAGSGTTGIATSLCDIPDSSTRQVVEDLLGPVEWGARNGILFDVSVLANFVSETLLNPPNPTDFIDAAKELLMSLNREWGWLYEANDTTSSRGGIRHTIWTDHLICPKCGTSFTFWDLAVTQDPPIISSVVQCNNCSMQFGTPHASRLEEDYWDDLLGETRRRRTRTPVFIYGRTGKLFWKRPISNMDLELIERINQTPIPQIVPVAPMMGITNDDRWGELYRSGYHSGVTHLHHFYTRRNLIALGHAWAAADTYSDQIRKALRFWISSYNGSHSTLMTRVVCKKNAKDFVVTSAEPAVLYIGSLPVEKNVFAGLFTKLGTISKAFEKMRNHSRTISINCASSLQTDLPNSSIDYIFTDPPFGDNIQYSEVNFINEAWLGKITEADEEVIVSRYQGKSVEHYHHLLAYAFTEAFRILKPGHYMTLVFHSTRPKMWDALRTAWEEAGFQIVRSTVLDKTQTSFKQTTTKGAVKGDPIILLRKPFAHCSALGTSNYSSKEQDIDDPWRVITDRLASLNESQEDMRGRRRQELYSYLVRYYLERGQSVPIDATNFFRELNRRFVCDDGVYNLS